MNTLGIFVLATFQFLVYSNPVSVMESKEGDQPLILQNGHRHRHLHDSQHFSHKNHTKLKTPSLNLLNEILKRFKNVSSLNFQPNVKTTWSSLLHLLQPGHVFPVESSKPIKRDKRMKLGQILSLKDGDDERAFAAMARQNLIHRSLLSVPTISPVIGNDPEDYAEINPRPIRKVVESKPNMDSNQNDIGKKFEVSNENEFDASKKAALQHDSAVERLNFTDDHHQKIYLDLLGDDFSQASPSTVEIKDSTIRTNFEHLSNKNSTSSKSSKTSITLKGDEHGQIESSESVEDNRDNTQVDLKDEEDEIDNNDDDNEDEQDDVGPENLGHETTTKSQSGKITHINLQNDKDNEVNHDSTNVAHKKHNKTFINLNGDEDLEDTETPFHKLDLERDDDGDLHIVKHQSEKPRVVDIVDNNNHGNKTYIDLQNDYDLPVGVKTHINLFNEGNKHISQTSKLPHSNKTYINLLNDGDPQSNVEHDEPVIDHPIKTQKFQTYITLLGDDDEFSTTSKSTTKRTTTTKRPTSTRRAATKHPTTSKPKVYITLLGDDDYFEPTVKPNIFLNLLGDEDDSTIEDDDLVESTTIQDSTPESSKEYDEDSPEDLEISKEPGPPEEDEEDCDDSSEEEYDDGDYELDEEYIDYMIPTTTESGEWVFVKHTLKPPSKLTTIELTIPTTPVPTTTRKPETTTKTPTTTMASTTTEEPEETTTERYEIFYDSVEPDVATDQRRYFNDDYRDYALQKALSSHRFLHR